MHTLPDVLARPPGQGQTAGANGPPTDTGSPTPPSALAPEPAGAARRARDRLGRLSAGVPELRWAFGVYMASRVLYLLIAVADTRLHAWTLRGELSNWDGVWYIRLAAHGYPVHISHVQTTLGFFPLYPILIWLVAQVLLFGSLVPAGVLVSLVGGFVATVLIGRLSADWWGEPAGRRAVLLFCLFPGSIVFSMVYAEGLMIALVAGCLLALQRRRWVLAGILAALATAVGPQALAIIPACAIAAALELRRRGWGDRQARRALLAPLLAPLGVIGFGAFLWVWSGTPFASYTAQRYGWDEKTDPLALVHVAAHVVHQISFTNFPIPRMNLNYDSGLLGAAFLLGALVLLFRSRPRIPAAALVWVLGIGALTVTSENVPPNPRLLIAAFPAVLVYAARLRGRAFAWAIGVSTVLLVAMSTVSFVGTALRP